MGYFTERKLNEAEVFTKGRHLVNGHYKGVIREHKVIDSSRKGKKGVEYFICGLKILEFEPAEGTPVAFKPGDEDASWIVNMSLGPSDSNVKAHFMACDPSIDPAAEDFNELADAAIGEEQIFEGLIIRAHAYGITTDDGNPFTVVKWWVEEGDNEEEED